MRFALGLTLACSLFASAPRAQEAKVPQDRKDASKDSKPKILCLFEEVKGTALEFLEVDGKPGKPRNIAEENEIRLAIPKAILGRLVELSTERDVSGLEKLQLVLLGATAAEQQAVASEGPSKFKLKFGALEQGYEAKFKVVASKSLGDSSYISLLLTVALPHKVVQIKCDAAVKKVGETEYGEPKRKRDKKRAFVTWYGPVEVPADALKEGE